MLSRLTIKDFILIEQLEVTFAPGFTTITGETGAGKSIFVGALSMLLGKRGESTLIRQGANRSIIEASFTDLPSELPRLLEDLDLPVDNSECILRREIAATGRSRAFINDTPASLANLSQVASLLIDIHSQHRNLLLSDSNFQLTAVDRLLPSDKPLLAYQKTYNEFCTAKRHRDEVAARLKEAADSYDYDSYRFKELDGAHISSGEEVTLREELDALEHAADIKKGLMDAGGLMQENDSNVLSFLAEAQQILTGISRFSASVAPYAERIAQTRIELSDITADLLRLADNADADPQRLEAVSERFDLLNRLISKYHARDTDELIALRNDLESRISLYESGDFELKEADKALTEAHTRMLTEAQTLHDARTKVAAEMANSLTQMLHSLEMPHAVVRIEIAQTEQPAPDGMDNVTLLFSANRTIEPRPVGEIASGGEISRLMLALKALLAEHESLPTILFDEIDTGVSGRTADRMGQMLARMGKVMQVIAITHLPQIAARSTGQLMIRKEEEPTPQTILAVLSPEERIREIARLLSGQNITPVALQAAQALLEHPND